jgi:uncharacterized membrane protein (UPF0127 family)
MLALPSFVMLCTLLLKRFIKNKQLYSKLIIDDGIQMKIKLKNSVMEADLADDFWKRLIGLSFSKKKNMLFIMSYEEKWSFWMFGVSYPLNIIFMNKNKEVVDIKKAEPLSFNPETWRTYVPRKPCKYVFETPLNLNINVGDKVSW